ncbi:uncharacterized protein LOC62_07G008974 [Vanrija pseudolonga]|uniref:FAS1 domain-containing protein n=1 Tax=Vanrija pseudolonga TaxID=143232 RepID=A0AAF0YES5_9TREE|nr:hypothetical protein LOC62_07G008974 [Vanrija pseudolonga]
MLRALTILAVAALASAHVLPIARDAPSSSSCRAPTTTPPSDCSTYAASLRASTFNAANNLTAWGDLLVAHADLAPICAALLFWRAHEGNVTIFVPPEDGGETLALLASQPELITNLYTDGTTRSLVPGQDFIYAGSTVGGTTRTASGFAVHPWRRVVASYPAPPPYVRDFLTFSDVNGTDVTAEVRLANIWLGMNDRETGNGNASYVYVSGVECG